MYKQRQTIDEYEYYEILLFVVSTQNIFELYDLKDRLNKIVGYDEKKIDILKNKIENKIHILNSNSHIV